MTEAIGIIGVGEIARAIVEGLCADGDAAPAVVLSPRGAAVSADLAGRYPSVRVGASNQEVADSASTVILSVRPDALHDALDGVRFAPGTVVISALAGVDHDELHAVLGPDVTVVRAIPLPAVRRRDSVTVIYPSHPEVAALFDRLGGALEVNDSAAFAALSAITGTLATHVHYLATIADWAGRHGVETAESDRYVRGMFMGLRDALADHSRSLPELAADHETPGGLNEQIRRTWFDESNVAALNDALDALLRRVSSA
jgi:pyrroline-5-carboxylate reductase